MHCISITALLFLLFWQCRGDVDWRRVLAVVVGKRGTFDVLFVCLWLMVMTSFSHQPLLNLEKENLVSQNWHMVGSMSLSLRTTTMRQFSSRWTSVVGLSKGIRRVLSHGILISIYNFFSLLIYDNDNEQPPIRHLDASSHSSGAVTQ